MFVNDTGKRLTWTTRNYFFLGTFFIVFLNLFIYAVCKSETYFFAVLPDWGKFSVNNLFQALVNSYTHINWQHVLLNMLCFAVAGSYLERKTGTLLFLLFLFVLSLFTSFASCTNDISISAIGFSGVNYGLYGYILCEYIFTLCRKNRRTLFNIIYGAAVLGLIYFAMCFSGGTTRVSFEWYPYDLLHNLGHASGFVVGLVMGAYEPVCTVIEKRSAL